MAFRFSAAMLAACLAILVMAVAAQEGMPNNMPGMNMSPSPPPDSQSTLAFPSTAVGLLAMVVSFLVFRERV
ncbi:hypothetical protein Acr_06g0002810 [Actinidia rufa]|uniref:Uncharacterized protein n=1 Tax=Actinidia rufa TaxID=165716 RepID=A0A7J0EPC2_9ERIC|nr:hypothetical protein Acr_06g0002810 [Actinidia rufa]